MNYRKHVEHFFLALICGIGSLAVSYLGKLSENIEGLAKNVTQLTVSVNVMSEKLVQSDKLLIDHESRIRQIERRVK